MSTGNQQDLSERVAEYLRGELAGELRSVSYFSPRSEGVTYLRDDVREQYTSAEIREIHHEILLDSTDHGRFEELAGSTLEATAQIFEDRVVTILTTGVQEGIVISLERGDDYSYLEVVAECQRVLEQP